MCLDRLDRLRDRDVSFRIRLRQSHQSTHLLCYLGQSGLEYRRLDLRGWTRSRTTFRPLSVPGIPRRDVPRRGLLLGFLYGGQRVPGILSKLYRGAAAILGRALPHSQLYPVVDSIPRLRFCFDPGPRSHVRRRDDLVLDYA